MPGGNTLKRKIIEAPCPNCDSQVILRLPKGAEEGDFSVDCQDCGESIDLEVSVTAAGKERIKINGRLMRPPREPPIKRADDRRKPSAKVVVDEDIEERWGTDYQRRMKIAFWVLIIVGILGVASSIATVTSSFTIKDLEEQSPNSTVSFAVWVFDSDTGRSVQGAEVNLRSGSYNISAISNNEGLAVLKNVRTGSLDMEIRHEEYKISTGTIWISKGSPNVLDVPMEKGSSSQYVEAPLAPLETKKYTRGLNNLTAIVMFLSSMTAFLTAFFVKVRDFFTLCVILSFLTIFSFGFLIGSILSLVAIVLIINSYEGFSHNYDLRMLLEQQGREDIKNFIRGERKAPMQLPPAK